MQATGKGRSVTLHDQYTQILDPFSRSNFQGIILDAQ